MWKNVEWHLLCDGSNHVYVMHYYIFFYFICNLIFKNRKLKNRVALESSKKKNVIYFLESSFARDHVLGTESWEMKSFEQNLLDALHDVNNQRRLDFCPHGH